MADDKRKRLYEKMTSLVARHGAPSPDALQGLAVDILACGKAGILPADDAQETAIMLVNSARHVQAARRVSELYRGGVPPAGPWPDTKLRLKRHILSIDATQHKEHTMRINAAHTPTVAIGTSTPQKVFESPTKPATSNGPLDRKKIIQQASSEYDSATKDTKQLAFCDRRAWINETLREVGLPSATDDEVLMYPIGPR